MVQIKKYSSENAARTIAQTLGVMQKKRANAQIAHLVFADPKKPKELFFANAGGSR
jgi:uncharacterized protein YejL (UPF0352 family)